MAALARNWLQVAALLAVLGLLFQVSALNWRKVIWAKETALLGAAIGIVAAYSIVSGFAYNIRYALPALFGFLALIAALSVGLPDRPRMARLLPLAVLAVALCADAQWFWHPRYRKPDARAVAKWLVDNRGRVKSWTLLPRYLELPLYWYLSGLDRETMRQALAPTDGLTTSFPPVPDVLILQRRDQLYQPDKLISTYCSFAGPVRTNRSFAGFELYVSDLRRSKQR
jgi:hypothetical protein